MKIYATICLKNLFTSIKNSKGHCDGYYLFSKILNQHRYHRTLTISSAPTFLTSLLVPSFPILQSSHIRLCTISSICCIHSYCHVLTLTVLVTPAWTTLKKLLLILQEPGEKKVVSLRSSPIPSLERQIFIMLSSRLSHQTIHPTNIALIILLCYLSIYLLSSA